MNRFIMSKSTFILKETCWILSILLVVLLLTGLIHYSFHGHISIVDMPWFISIFAAIDLIVFYNHLKRIKKLGIDLGLPENQQGILYKTIVLQMPKAKVLDMLNQNVWKYKTESKEETEQGTLLRMKHYRLFAYERLEILLSETGPETCKVQLAAGVKKIIVG